VKRILILTAFFLLALTGSAQQKIRLNDHWEFLKQDLGGIWEAVRPVGKGNPESVPLWENVSLPHCVNAVDAVDPDVNYYQGPSWYRTQLTFKNRYESGRTLLHFEGAGQKTDVYIYTTKVGSHVGGYDEWTVDITDAVKEFEKSEAFQKQFNGKIPLSIRVDNSRDLEMIPSSFRYNLPYVLCTIGFALFAGLAAGIAPAWILSAFKPLRVLKNLSTAKIFGKVGLQKTLIVFQYSLSLVIIIFLISFYRQFSFMAAATSPISAAAVSMTSSAVTPTRMRESNARWYWTMKP